MAKARATKDRAQILRALAENYIAETTCHPECECESREHGDCEFCTFVAEVEPVLKASYDLGAASADEKVRHWKDEYDEMYQEYLLEAAKNEDKVAVLVLYSRHRGRSMNDKIIEARAREIAGHVMDDCKLIGPWNSFVVPSEVRKALVEVIADAMRLRAAMGTWSHVVACPGGCGPPTCDTCVPVQQHDQLIARLSGEPGGKNDD